MAGRAEGVFSLCNAALSASSPEIASLLDSSGAAEEDAAVPAMASATKTVLVERATVQETRMARRIGEAIGSVNRCGIQKIHC